MTDKVKLQLGDIIEVIAPNDSEIHNKVYYIEYIDADKLRLEEADGSEILLTLTEGHLDNESIERIIIKSRAEESGYARQNNLIIGVWVDVFFNGDLPLTITGKITNLEEDRIEITTYPENDVVFIDFEYQGLPEYLPIEKIKIRRAPDTNLMLDKTTVVNPKPKTDAETDAEPDANAETEPNLDELKNSEILGIENEQGTGDEYIELDIDSGTKTITAQEAREQIKTMIFNADQIKFGEDLEDITQLIDVPEEEKRYDIEKQLDDMLNDLLSSVPNADRTDEVKNNINTMIQRFKQLRNTFSEFDNKGYAKIPKSHDSTYKPLLKTLENLEKKLHWIIPVAKTIKKIYATEDKTPDDNEEEPAEDIEMLFLSNERREEETIINNYKNNNNEGEQNKYDYLQKELNHFQLPYHRLTDVNEKNSTLLNKPVNTTITAIIDNLGDFNSSVKGNDTFSMPHSTNESERKQPQLQKRFAIQNYTVGNTKLDITKVRGENPIIKRVTITPNDTIDIQSILTLPKPALYFSRINMNVSSILDKSSLNLHYLHYWQLLNQTTRVYRKTISDLDKPYSHDSDKYLNKTRNYRMNAEVLEKLNSKNKAMKESKHDNASLYHTFLDSVIPKTSVLFDVIKPYINNLSLNEILTYLEPFMIYQPDLSFLHYTKMTEYISEKILEYKKNYLAKSRQYNSIKGSQTILIPSFIKLFDENPNLKTKVLDVYGFTDTITQMKNAEFFKHIMEVDNGIFYYNAVGLISTNLMIADGSRDITDIDMYLNNDAGNTEDYVTGKTGKIGKTGKLTGKKKTTKMTEATPYPQEGELAECSKIKVVAKRYIDLDELLEDNGKEIFFDKKYDITPYEIQERFKVDPAMKLGEQIKFYMDKIIQMKKVDQESARRDAESIVKQKRTVEDGDYAILEITDDVNATLQYYTRSNEQWVLDDSIDAETFADSAKMFCNLNEKCISVKNTCTDETTGASELKKQNLKLLLSEFDTTLNVNKDIIVNKIEDALKNADARIEILKNIRKLKLYKNETIKMTLGNTLTGDTIENRIRSPYDGLLSTIMGQPDISKRYKDICKFVSLFTRESNIDTGENKYWFYCVSTNKQMLPTFIYKLATAFLKGYDYTGMLNRICAEQGTISEDGDKWVDKHSGYTIKMIDLNEAEEYNEEGFKIISHAVIEEDVGDTIMREGEKRQEEKDGNQKTIIARKYSSADANKIYNVIESLSKNMGIVLHEKYDFIVRNVLKQLSNTSVMPTKDKYEKLLKLTIAKGKTMDTYEDAYNSTLLYLTFAYYLISIQISIPPIKTKITFPGCKKSFSGFPIDGTDNNSGLVYVACVSHKIRNNASLPWSSIKTRSASYIAKQMESMITKYILPTDEIQNGIKEVKTYSSSNPEQDIPEEHSIEKWYNFLPPLKKIKMTTTQDVGDVFKSRLTESLRKGTQVQHDSISEVKSKMRLFSFGIIDLIEQIVKKENALLKTRGGEPFLQNACCDEGDINTLQYFIKQQPEIAVLNNRVVKLSDIYDDIQRMTRASFLYDPSNTKRKLRKLDEAFSETTIYRAFIVYCKFNSLTPLNDDLKAICPTKPDGFNPNDSLDESIRKLKSNARNYNTHSLGQLLNIINTSTMQTIESTPSKLTNAEHLSFLLTKIDQEETRPAIFRNAFMEVLEQFELNSLTEDTSQLRKFKNVLAKMNDDMQTQVISFVKENKMQLKKTNFNKFKLCIETIMEFNKSINEEESHYKLINFMKKTIRSMTKEYPNIIKNNINNFEEDKGPIVAYGEQLKYIKRSKYINEHWGFSDKHATDLFKSIKKHYADFQRFYNDDQTKMLMGKLMEKIKDISELSSSTLFYSPVELMNKGKSKNQSESESKSKNDSESKSESKSKNDSESKNDSKSNSAIKSKSKDSNKPMHSYSVFDIDLTTLLFHFYFLSILTDLISFQDDTELLQLPLLKSQTEQTEENLFMTKEDASDVLVGNKAELADKIAHIIIVFTDSICVDKKAINYNYQQLLELLLRSKEKEKDDMTNDLESKNDEEREIDTFFKQHKLGKWSIGEQKGFRNYEKGTYDQERETMEKMAAREVNLNNRNIVTDMNRDIFQLDMIAEEAADDRIEREDNTITYMGEDAEPEDYGMDGDENY